VIKTFKKSVWYLCLALICECAIPLQILLEQSFVNIFFETQPIAYWYYWSGLVICVCGFFHFHVGLGSGATDSLGVVSEEGAKNILGVDSGVDSSRHLKKKSKIKSVSSVWLGSTFHSHFRRISAVRSLPQAWWLKLAWRYCLGLKEALQQQQTTFYLLQLGYNITEDFNLWFFLDLQFVLHI
jgi:hypothetical protein